MYNKAFLKETSNILLLYLEMIGLERHSEWWKGVSVEKKTGICLPFWKVWEFWTCFTTAEYAGVKEKKCVYTKNDSRNTESLGPNSHCCFHNACLQFFAPTPPQSGPQPEYVAIATGSVGEPLSSTQWFTSVLLSLSSLPSLFICKWKAAREWCHLEADSS